MKVFYNLQGLRNMRFQNRQMEVDTDLVISSGVENCDVSILPLSLPLSLPFLSFCFFKIKYIIYCTYYITYYIFYFNCADILLTFFF